MDKDLEKLINTATQARDRAYAPYSKHPVGASLLTADGRIFGGCNVENAASPLGNCAEILAIGSMVASGGREIEHVVIVGPGEALCTPCGGCRQVIREFSNDQTRITVCDKDGVVLLETSLSDLLPHSFGPANLSEVQGNSRD